MSVSSTRLLSYYPIAQTYHIRGICLPLYPFRRERGDLGWGPRIRHLVCPAAPLERKVILWYPAKVLYIVGALQRSWVACGLFLIHFCGKRKRRKLRRFMFSIQTGFLIGVKCSTRNPCNALTMYNTFAGYHSTGLDHAASRGATGDAYTCIQDIQDGRGRHTAHANLWQFIRYGSIA